MPKLLSEDKQVITIFEVVLLKELLQKKENISWVPYKLIIKSADKELVFEKKEKKTGSGDYVFALQPINEVKNFITGIKDFLESKNKKIFSFEAIEPSFEFTIERSFKGYSVTCWVDAGNVTSDHYSWDGFGVRFFTTEKNILSFIEELNNEITNNA